MVHRFHMQKSCCRVIAISQAGIAALTLTPIQELEGNKKRMQRISLLPSLFPTRISIDRDMSQTHLTRIEPESEGCKTRSANHYTISSTYHTCQNALFKPNVLEKSSRALRLIAVARVSFIG